MSWQLDCQFCRKLPGTKTRSYGVKGAKATYAWCGSCRAESCWDCGAIGKFLSAPIRDDKDYRICEDCFHGTTSDRV